MVIVLCFMMTVLSINLITYVGAYDTTSKSTSTAPSNMPSTIDSVEELRPYRIAKYKEIFDKETIYFEISYKYSETETIPTTFARKNGDMYIETVSEGVNVKGYYEKSTNKMYAYALGFYYVVPENEMADMNMTEYLDEVKIKDVGDITVEKTEFNSETVIKESYYNTETGYTMNYYFDDETLIGIKKEHQIKVDEIFYVHKVGNTVADEIFNRPIATPFSGGYNCEIGFHKWICVDADGSNCGGFYRWYECEYCKAEKTKFIPPTIKHNWGSWDGEPASCFEPGCIEYWCGGCETSKTEILPAYGEHDEYYIINNDATCTEDGTKTLACKRCDFKGEKEIDEGSALGHNYKNGWQIIKTPDCEDKGIAIQICNRCLFIESRDLEKTKHTDSNSDSVCDVCGEKLNGSADTNKPADTPQTPQCSCNCHISGLKNLLFKIVLFFQKILGQNKICDCGVVHY